MKPAPFGYHRRHLGAEAVAALSSLRGRGPGDRRRAEPGADAEHAAHAARRPRRHQRHGGTGRDPCGTATRPRSGRWSATRRSRDRALVAERLALLARMVRHIGDRQVRNRGTIGGSLAQGDPTGEMPLACLVLGARVTVTGPDGRREIPVARPLPGLLRDRPRPLRGADRDRLPARSGPLRVRRAVPAPQRLRGRERRVPWATAGRTAGGPGSGSALGGVADQPVLAAAASAVASGSQLSDEVIAAAAQAALEVVDPPSDIRASAEYRRHLVPIYVRRVLTELRFGGRGTPATPGGQEGPDMKMHQEFTVDRAGQCGLGVLRAAGVGRGLHARAWSR